MEIALKELDLILSVQDRYELNEFHVKLKRCALAGHDFKTCLTIMHASEVSGADVDSIMSAMRVSANRVDSPKGQPATDNETCDGCVLLVCGGKSCENCESHGKATAEYLCLSCFQAGIDNTVNWSPIKGEKKRC